MSKSPLRIAAVGTGYFSHFHFDAWRRLPVEVAGICSLSKDEATAVAGTFGRCGSFVDFEDMLDEVCPDLVDIITPPVGHMDFIAAVAARGVGMICQKPFTRSLLEARAAADTARQAGVLLVVHENFRFQPWHMKIKELIGSGIIGNPYQVSFRLRPGDGQGPDAYLNRQPYFQKMQRFLVHETAIHLIDVFRYFFGEIASVTADLATLNPVIAGEDAGLIIFHFENGVRGLFDGNRLADHCAQNRRLTMGDMLVEGSDAVIRLNGDGEIFIRRFGENQEVQVDFPWDDTGFAGDSVFRFQKHVIDHLMDGTEIVNTAQAYLSNLGIEDAVYRSHGQGARVGVRGER